MKIHSLLFLPIVCVILSFSSGCATQWAMNEYGKRVGHFESTGPVHGDATQIYAQGRVNIYSVNSIMENDRPSESHPAVLYVELNEGQAVVKEIYEGVLAPEILELPKIIFIPNPENKLPKDVFMESGHDIALVGNWKSLYVKRPEDIDYANLVNLWEVKRYPRAGSDKVLYPFVFAGAVVADCVIITGATALVIASIIYVDNDCP